MLSSRMVRRSLLVSVLVLSSVTTGCGVILHERGHGPPSHAPAHGHRGKHKHHHHDVALEFDPHLGVYAVISRPGFYFLDDHYYRMIDGDWHVAINVGGPWEFSTHEYVPFGLVKVHGAGKSKGKKGKGKGKGK